MNSHITRIKKGHHEAPKRKQPLEYTISLEKMSVHVLLFVVAFPLSLKAFILQDVK